MSGARAFVAVAAACALGCSTRTSFLVSIDAPGVKVASLRLGVVVNGVDKGNWAVPQSGGPPHLPGTAEIDLPDVQAIVDVKVSAIDDQNNTLTHVVTRQSVPHQQVRVDVVLSEGTPGDGFVADDLTKAPPDLAGADLLPPPPDLLPPPDLAGTVSIALVQVHATQSTSNGLLTVSLNVPSSPGTLLVATIMNADNAPVVPQGNAWTLAAETTNGSLVHAAIYFYPNNPGNLSSTSFASTAANLKGQLSEWSGAALTPLDKSSTGTAIGATKAQVSSGVVVYGGELAITSFGLSTSTSTSGSFAPGLGWTALGTSGIASSTYHYEADYRLGVAANTSVTDAETANVAGDWAAVIATFHP